jgi:MtN3 and saliva related transmembrane protein
VHSKTYSIRATAGKPAFLARRLRAFNGKTALPLLRSHPAKLQSERRLDGNHAIWRQKRGKCEYGYETSAAGSGGIAVKEKACAACLFIPTVQFHSMDSVELLGLAASLLVIVSWIPQLKKSLKTRQMKDFSWGMLSLLFTSQVMFLAYGVLIESLPVVLTNAFTALFIGALAFLKIKHG